MKSRRFYRFYDAGGAQRVEVVERNAGDKILKTFPASILTNPEAFLIRYGTDNYKTALEWINSTEGKI